MSIFALAITRAVAGQTYAIPEPDLRVVVDVQALRKKANDAHGWTWSGTFTRNDRICSSPDVHLELNHPDLWFRGANDLLGGTATTEVRILGSPRVFTRDKGCMELGLSAGCLAKGCTIAPFGQILFPIDVSCHFLGIPFASESIPLVLPFEAHPSLEISIPEPSAGAETFAEFGSFANEKWTPLPTPRRRTLRLVQTIRALGGRELAPRTCSANDDPRDCDDPMCRLSRYEDAVLQRRDAPLLAVDTSISPEQFAPATSVEQAAEALAADETLDPGHFAGISISRRLLEGDTRGRGLFQRILPVRIFGHRKINGTRIEFEAMATEARLVPGKIDGRDAFRVQFVVSRASAWLAGKRSTSEVTIPRVGLDGVAFLPNFSSSDGENASLRWSLAELRMTFSAKVGSLTICVKKERVEQTLGELKVDLARSLGPRGLFPDCISMGGDQMVADRPCPDGVQQGRLSADLPEKNISLAIDLGRASIGFTSEGRWRLSVPSAR